MVSGPKTDVCGRSGFLIELCGCLLVKACNWGCGEQSLGSVGEEASAGEATKQCCGASCETGVWYSRSAQTPSSAQDSWTWTTWVPPLAKSGEMH